MELFCHTGAAGAPATGAGKVLPLRHVDGSRDVVFDGLTWSLTLGGVGQAPPARYDPAKKTCSNVPATWTAWARFGALPTT